MKKGLLSLQLALCLAFSALGASKADPVLMTVNKKPVTISEFEYLYNKNNAQQMATQPIDEYLDMFVIYKLKVADAEAAGIDTTDAFKNEYAGYARDLSEPYLTDADTRENLIRNIYERLKEEVDVSHIMIERKLGASAEAAQKSMLDSLRKEIIAGRADFAKVADSISIDPAVSRNHGHMGYISACRYPYTFEDAAYTTAVGDISGVITTPFGYHIVKVNDRRPAQGEVLVQHILKLTQGLSEEDKAIKKAEADSIYALLQNGADFDSIARIESEDPGSARNGGRLNWFSTGMMVPEFEKESFALTNGEISRPFESRFGYHIIKRIDWKGIPSYEELAPRISDLIDRDERRMLPMQAKTRQLREKYQATVDTKISEQIKSEIIAASGLDSALVNKFANDDRIIVHLSKGNKSATVSDMFSTLPLSFQKIDTDEALTLLNDRIEQVADEAATNAERTNLAAENPEYRNLLNEYRDGMLLFEISDKNVWSRSKNDKKGLEAFFNANRAKYATWTAPKFKGYIIFSTSDSIKESAIKYLAGHTVSNEDLVNKMRELYGKEIKVERVLAARGENAIIDGIAFGGEIPAPSGKWKYYFPYDHSIIDQPEEAADERGAVTTDYQNQLEQEWVKQLRKKYKVKINDKVLKEFKASFQPAK